MPHLKLEYTGNIKQEVDTRELFSKLHQLLVEVGGLRLENCKSRAVRLDTYHIGGGENSHAFVHLDIRFLAGRSLDLKQEIGQKSLDVLEAHFAPSLHEFELQISVEVRDIQGPTYFKVPGGTLP